MFNDFCINLKESSNIDLSNFLVYPMTESTFIFENYNVPI